ncbi:MAG: hypothetical protein JWM82_2539 [Myxococcales bacterium]|nr:hypothetical protein [Myxococcales bacterium]
MFPSFATLTPTIRDGLDALGVERLVLTVHDSSFPSAAEEDVGRGSSYGRGARQLVALASSLGFDGLQLGPQGATTASNPSPYDGAHRTRSPALIALATLADDPAWAPLCEGLLGSFVAGRPNDGGLEEYAYAWRVGNDTARALHARFRGRLEESSELASRFDAFKSRAATLLSIDGLYEGLSEAHGTDDWRRWTADQDVVDSARRSSLAATHAVPIERHLFGQFVLDEQHRALRRVTAARKMALFGDLQIGFSHRDVWSQRRSFRSDYLMGAPPSRTNPQGQPWGYPVLDSPERALHLLAVRLERMLADFDGIRIDHPHGLVCPWVYRADDPDPARAVTRGARFFCSPGLPDHPALAPLAIPKAEQLSGDPGVARYADDWVQALSDAQVDRYGHVFDAILARVRAAGRRETDVVCEVLSTWPYPLRRVMERHGLGRFCVTQKADLGRPADVYRSENASTLDWIMVGNHDTQPLWLLADAWHGTATGSERALALAKRLCPSDDKRPRLARWIAADARHLAHAMFAELFIGPARRVSMFFADWLGMRGIYNRPGIVHPDNWLLRIPSSFLDDYRVRVAQGSAFNPPLALALALAASRTPDAVLVLRLLEAARQLNPALDPEVLQLVTGR